MPSSSSNRQVRIFGQIVSLVAAVFWVQCAGTPTGTDSVAAAVTVSAPGHSLHTLGDTLVLRATVTNQAGATIPGAPVIWSSLAPAVATVGNGVVTAVKNGNAQIIALSGTISGQATVTVQQVSRTLSKASADTQAGVYSQALPQPVTVIARDSGGHLAAGIKVGFAVAVGGGSVAADSVATDSLGHAADTWTLGNTLGTQTLIVGVSAPAIADTFFATGADGFDSLPQTVATVQAAVDFITTGQINSQVYCAANPTVNCANGTPTPTPLALTRDSVSIVEAPPGTYSFAARVAVVSTTDITFIYSGVSCTLSLNTTAGTSPTIRVTGTAMFTRQLPSDPINRIDITNVATSAIESVDATVHGSTACSLVPSAVVLSMVNGILHDAFADAGPRLCGAPGPALLEPCPRPPTLAFLSLLSSKTARYATRRGSQLRHRASPPSTRVLRLHHAAFGV